MPGALVGKFASWLGVVPVPVGRLLYLPGLVGYGFGVQFSWAPFGPFFVRM